MRDRHFIEPSEGSALSLYRSALLLAPGNGEAQQGLKRLSEILVGRVQSALDEKQFDAALQALETVRSIDPNDPRLPALDERIAKMRDELGPAEIQAAINAQNFDRATQLIDQAVRSQVDERIEDRPAARGAAAAPCRLRRFAPLGARSTRVWIRISSSIRRTTAPSATSPRPARPERWRATCKRGAASSCGGSSRTRTRPSTSGASPMRTASLRRCAASARRLRR